MKTYFPALPKARTVDIVVSELKDEILLYRVDTHKAYCLNKTAAAVYQSADGTKSASEIADLLSHKLKSIVTEEFVLFALNELEEKNLLENFAAGKSETNRHSRREAIKKIAVSSAVALPIISMIIAPTAASAQSVACQADGQTCDGVTTVCCSPLVCTSGTCTPPCANIGETCGGSTVCCSGLTCDAGVCIDPSACRPAGASCTSNSQCCGDNCDIDSGVCVDL